MAKKAKLKIAEQQESKDGADSKPRGSRKMLIAAAAICVLSLGSGFFLARMAYMEDAEAFEPEYKANNDDHDGSHIMERDASKDGHGSAHGKDEASKLRKDITDPLAKDGHDAEKALALKEQKSDDHGVKGKQGEVVDSGLLDFGEMLTNIQGIDGKGQPKTAFLKVSLMVAYRPDEGSGKLMMERQPFMRDLFNGYLRGLSEPDVRGMAGVLYIKAELLKRARAAVGSDLPQEVLINDLIVQ